MVHYKIYNKTVNLPFDDFCAAIRVPQWGSRERMRERPKPLMDLYKDICQGRSFSDEDGKIQSIQLPSIRYFAFFIAKCVLARKTANKLSAYDLAFISAGLRRDITYNLGALIAFRLTTNREKGEICGGLIASRLLAFHGVVPHYLDIQFPLEKLNLDSMIQHKFVSPQINRNSLAYEITFFKKSGWRLAKFIRSVDLPAPLLFNLDNRERWSLTEHDLDKYIEEHCQHAGEDERDTEDNFAQRSSTAGSSYRQPDYDYGPSVSSSSRGPVYDHARDDPPAWSGYPSWD
jgi:hypothetical protein